MAWPNNGNNEAPTARYNISVAAGDHAYIQALDGKPYMAPVFMNYPLRHTSDKSQLPGFPHIGVDCPTARTGCFRPTSFGTPLERSSRARPRFVEITWNDYGESHYIGALASPHTDDGSCKWVMDM